MNDDVTRWPTALLAEVYAELTGATVEVDDSEADGVIPTITGVDDRGQYVLVKFRVPQSLSTADTDSAMVQRTDLVNETRDRARVHIDES
ncbi:hypothetical protein [Halobaculum sp. D14]|uniref:hypothetical protein n=1 Tax=unclassified Halobaculum TaxID=2640896 RepID=UPI003EBAE87E